MWCSLVWKKKKRKRGKIFFPPLSLLLEFMFVVCVCTGVFCVFMCECVFDTRRSVTTELIQSMPIFRVWPRYHAADKLPVHRGMSRVTPLHMHGLLHQHSHSLMWGYISLDTVHTQLLCLSHCMYCNSSICILPLSWHFEERKKMIKVINHKDATTLAGPHCRTVQSEIRSVTAELSGFSTIMQCLHIWLNITVISGPLIWLAKGTVQHCRPGEFVSRVEFFDQPFTGSGKRAAVWRLWRKSQNSTW